MIRRGIKNNATDESNAEEYSEERAERIAATNDSRRGDKLRQKELLGRFKKESDNLERRLCYDLKTLSEIERTTETMRKYVTNGAMYEDIAVATTVSVSECIKMKRTSQEKNRSSSFLASNQENETDNDNYNNHDNDHSNHSNHSNQYSDNSRSEDNCTPRFHSDFIGENVFLTAEPFEEMKGQEQGQGQGQEEYSDNNVDRTVETGIYVCACVYR